MFEVFIKTTFSSAHNLRGYKGSCKNLHGHNWNVDVCIKAEKLNKLGMVKDFRELKAVVTDAVSELDHKNINNLPQFKEKNPTAENLAAYLFKTISGEINNEDIKVSRVTVSESHRTGVSYWEE